ncbi:MAG: phage tail tube protein [Xanthobacteraceae bacterium]
MATSALPRGKVTDFLLKSETTFGEAPSGNWTKTFIYSFTPGFRQPYENDALLGLARHNNRDTTQPAPGLIVNDPGLVVPIDFNHIGLWLYALFGAASVSGAGDPYTHSFSSGLEVLPWRSHERKYANVLFYQDLGQVANTLELEMSRAAGFQRATLGFMGQTEAKVTSTGGGTPAAAWAREDCPAALGVFKVNGTAAANIMSVKAKYDNKITPQDYVGSLLRSGFDLDSEATFDGSIDLRFTDSTYYDLAIAGTAFSGEMLWSKSSDRSLSLLAANMRLEPVGVPIQGPGKIQQTFNFRAEQSDSDAMLVATLKSSVESYTI